MDVKFSAVILALMMLTCLAVLPSGSSSVSKGINEPASCHADRNDSWTMGLLSCTNSTSAGFTLFSPLPSNTSYLIDNQGREVHSWASPGEHRPGLSAYLLEDGDLLRTANIGQQSVGDFSGGGIAGKIERIAWDGTAEWSWEYSSMNSITHHDIEPMPNGNILVLCWEKKTYEEAQNFGRININEEMWPLKIVEIQPIGSDDANIVWQWHLCDHVVQDVNS